MFTDLGGNTQYLSYGSQPSSQAPPQLFGHIMKAEEEARDKAMWCRCVGGWVSTWKAALGFCVPCLLFLLAILAKCSTRVPCCLQWSRAAYANICAVKVYRGRRGVQGGNIT